MPRCPMVALATLVAVAACAADRALDVDAAAPDATTGEADAATSPLFTISGACDELDEELTSAAPAAFVNHMLFHRRYADGELETLTAGGQEIVSDGNLGGGSLLSEVFAFENLAACEGAALIKTETEIIYDIEGKKTDFTTELDGIVIGVSVVRAQTFPLGADLTIDDARGRLDGKLSDILESSFNVSAADRWAKQLLAVLVYNDQHADALATALPMIDAATRADTIVWLTITDGPDEPIYE